MVQLLCMYNKITLGFVNIVVCSKIRTACGGHLTFVITEGTYGDTHVSYIPIAQLKGSMTRVS